MINVEYRITLYGESFSAADFLLEGNVTAKPSKRNPHIIHIYPVGKQTASVFMSEVFKSVKKLWEMQAKKQLIGYIEKTHADRFPEIGLDFHSNFFSNNYDKKAIDGIFRSLLETGGAKELKTALTLFFWEEKNNAQKRSLEKGVWTFHTRPGLNGRFYFQRFGIEEQNLHLDVGYAGQCNYETDEKTVAFMGKLGLSLSFSCFEEDLEAKNIAEDKPELTA